MIQQAQLSHFGEQKAVSGRKRNWGQRFLWSWTLSHIDEGRFCHWSSRNGNLRGVIFCRYKLPVILPFKWHDPAGWWFHGPQFVTSVLPENETVTKRQSIDWFLLCLPIHLVWTNSQFVNYANMPPKAEVIMIFQQGKIIKWRSRFN